MTEIKIDAHNGGSFMAYAAYPKAASAPCVIVIQEIFGVNAEMRAKCDALAAKGYMAVCPDLFWRIEPGIQLVDSVETQLQRAFELFGLFDVGNGIRDLSSTLAHVRGMEECNGKAGFIGYCLGGKLAYMMAAKTDADASISYYGVGIENMLEMAADVNKPLLMHIAENDQFVPPEAQAKIRAGLARYPQITVHSYPGADHAFARDNGMHYDAQAARLANARTDEFLQKHLKI